MRLRRLAIVALPLVAVPAVALAAPTYKIKPWVSSQPSTQAAPSGSDEGLSLGSVSGFRLTACATTATIATACTLKAYIYSEATGLWVRSAASNADGLGHLDWEILAADVGKACVTFPDQLPTARRGRVFYATSGCDALTLYIEAVGQ